MFSSIFAAINALILGKTAKPPEPAAASQRTTSAGRVTPRPEVLTGAFAPDFVGEADDKRYPIRTTVLGELHLPSGRLVGVDPFIVREGDKPFEIEVSPGRYAVELAVADAGESGQRVALARVRFSDQPPVRWSLAVIAGQDPAALEGDAIFGYGVDTGTGSFMDAGAAAWMAAQPWEALEPLQEDWQARGEAHGPELGIPYGFALVETVGPGGAAMFSSGWGDGYYASWVGYDAEGRPAVLVTDFAVITAVNIPGA